MKTLLTLAAIAAFSGVAYAQMATLPPASTTDGVPINSIGLNTGATHWDAPSGISSFRVDGLTEGTNRINTVVYNPIGLPFGSSIPTSFQANLDMINLKGGVIRTIFLAESAGWNNSLGYTYSGNFAGPQSFTAFSHMQDTATTTTPANIKFGDYFDISLPIGSESKFDLWFQGEDTVNGGDYTLFHPSNSSANIAPGNALWSQTSVVANTWNATLNAYVDVSTYVVGLEDWRLDRGSDRDYSDAVIAMQFYTLSGVPFTLEAVPEPSTYGLIGACALLGLVVLRGRIRRVAA